MIDGVSSQSQSGGKLHDANDVTTWKGRDSSDHRKFSDLGPAGRNVMTNTIIIATTKRPKVTMISLRNIILALALAPFASAFAPTSTSSHPLALKVRQMPMIRLTTISGIFRGISLAFFALLALIFVYFCLLVGS